MPHAESEHGLRVQLATALREHERTQEALGEAFEDLRAEQKRAEAAESALAAARRECEGLKRIGDALIEKIYSLVRGPDIVDEVRRICRAALAAPAAASGGDSK